MQPAVDVFVGKKVDWNSFKENPDFYLKHFDMRYTIDGVHIMRRKNGKAMDQRRECRQ